MDISSSLVLQAAQDGWDELLSPTQMLIGQEPHLQQHQEQQQQQQRRRK